MSPSEPQPEAEDLGRRLRDLAKSDTAPEDGLARLRARLGASLPGVVDTNPSPPKEPAATTAASEAVRSAKLLFGAVGLFVGAVVGALAMHVVDARHPVVKIVEVPAPIVQQAPPAQQPSATPTAEPLVSAIPAPRALPKASASAGSKTNAERLVVDEARAAYARGARKEALDSLARHVAQFPNGALAEEREALAVRILVDSGNVTEARKRGEAFRARYPKSLMLPAVHAALESIP